MIPGFIETLDEMKRIAEAKNHDYAGEENPFKNFCLVEDLGITSVENGILVRMTDKYSRVINLLQREGMVKDEKITDTLVDLANYAIILKCWLDDKTSYDEIVKDFTTHTNITSN